MTPGKARLRGLHILGLRPRKVGARGLRPRMLHVPGLRVRRLRVSGVCLAATAVLQGALGTAVPIAAGARDAEIDPVGVFVCLTYGPSGDQRFYLSLAPEGAVHVSRVAEAEEGEWRPLGTWRRARGRIELNDQLNGRLFTAALQREDLGGTWLGARDRGGWWCAVQPRATDDAPPPSDRLMQSLVPAIMASPIYPRRAIREAIEGRTVSCFIVTGTGEIQRPDVVESTHEIFREPTLAAIGQSRYQSWGDENATLPACRSFTFELSAEG